MAKARNHNLLTIHKIEIDGTLLSVEEWSWWDLAFETCSGRAVKTVIYRNYWMRTVNGGDREPVTTLVVQDLNKFTRLIPPFGIFWLRAWYLYINSYAYLFLPFYPLRYIPVSSSFIYCPPTFSLPLQIDPWVPNVPTAGPPPSQPVGYGMPAPEGIALSYVLLVAYRISTKFRIYLYILVHLELFCCCTKPESNI